jgi:hypothetical protein
MRMTNKMHTFSHSFIPIKLSSTCFEQIIVHQKVTSVHAAYSILPFWNYIKIMWIIYIYNVIKSMKKNIYIYTYIHTHTHIYVLKSVNVKAPGAQGWQPCHHVSIIWKSGSLILLEPLGPVQACTGVALPLYSWS